MLALSPPQLEVARLIVGTLNLEDIGANDIDPNAPLFREGLGLDSIDALELALAIKQKYGLQIGADDEENIRVFSSLATLTDHIEQHRS